MGLSKGALFLQILSHLWSISPYARKIYRKRREVLSLVIRISSFVVKKEAVFQEWGNLLYSTEGSKMHNSMQENKAELGLTCSVLAISLTKVIFAALYSHLLGRKSHRGQRDLLQNKRAQSWVAWRRKSPSNVV